MKRLFIFVMVIVGAIWAIMTFTTNRKPLGSITTSSVLQISSQAFANNGLIPNIYSCKGAGVNPPLQFSGVSGDARSLALIVDDPTVSKAVYTHWIVYNMLPTTKNIAENSIPRGIVLKNSSDIKGYAAVCPPSGEHRYTFTLYELDTVLPNDYINTKADLMAAMSGHIMDQTQLIGRFSNN